MSNYREGACRACNQGITDVEPCACPTRESVVHQAPAPGHGTTTCCRMVPFELPHGDRITNDPSQVTCWTGDDPRFTPAKEADR